MIKLFLLSRVKNSSELLFRYKCHLFLVVLLFGGSLYAQRDSLVFDNNKHLIGEIGGMKKGILMIDVEFGDDDFPIEWNAVNEIYTDSEFLISMRDRTRYNGVLSGQSDSVQIITSEADTVLAKLDDIVYLEDYDTSFKDRFSASIDAGLSLTKANNLKQFNSRSSLGYSAQNWNLRGSINSVISEQDDQEERTRRTDASIAFRYILQRGWFLFPELLFLSSTELNLKLRTIAKAGIGNYIFRTNRAYWALTAGFSRTVEDFTDNQTDRNSWELVFGTDVDLFDIGDLNVSLDIDAYPSLTESGRFRSDITFDIKYDLPLDFYIRLGTTYNYDNRPAEGASESDYVVQSGLGWEF